MRRVIFCLLLVVAICSCVQDATEDILVNVESEDSIYAIIEDDSRVELTKSHQMVWTKSDYIYVYGPDIRKKYMFNGNTGDKGGTFTLNSTYSPLSTNINCYYAASSPHTGGYGISSGRLRLYSPASGTFTQEYDPVSGTTKNVNMVFGVSDDGQNFSFKGIMGYLRISLTGDKVVKSINLTNNSGDKISGRYYFYVDDPETVLFQTSYNPLPTILLDCGEGVQLNDKPTDFYFTIRQMELSAGVTIEVTFTDGTTFVQSTSKPITIKRNTIQPMATISTSNVVYQQLNITHDNRVFVMPTITGETSLSGYVDLGDGMTSILNLFTSYEYLDDKPTHTVSIKLRNASSFQMDGCDGITEIDLSNF